MRRISDRKRPEESQPGDAKGNDPGTYLLENFLKLKSSPAEIEYGYPVFGNRQRDAVLMVETVARRYVEENEGLKSPTLTSPGRTNQLPPSRKTAKIFWMR
jgi:hypothetical protein